MITTGELKFIYIEEREEGRSRFPHNQQCSSQLAHRKSCFVLALPRHCFGRERKARVLPCPHSL